MQFLLNTDQHIHGDQRLAEIAEDTVTAALGPLVNRLTRVEVHLRDVNAQKGGADDIRCVIEARPEGLQPHSVSHDEATVAAALKGAARKLRSHLDSEFGRLETRR
ncbi:MAG: HPF/RaiA family ribosome-associated protein [Paracoccaceae bacterium]